MIDEKIDEKAMRAKQEAAIAENLFILDGFLAPGFQRGLVVACLTAAYSAGARDAAELMLDLATRVEGLQK
jgi:hypothetical protein